MVLWATAASLVPAMTRGNDAARTAHITLNSLNILLFAWQVRFRHRLLHMCSTVPSAPHGVLCMTCCASSRHACESADAPALAKHKSTPAGFKQKMAAELTVCLLFCSFPRASRLSRRCGRMSHGHEAGCSGQYGDVSEWFPQSVGAFRVQAGRIDRACPHGAAMKS